MMRFRCGAFTLVEVMVALAIIALSLTAVAAKMGRMIDTSNAMRERTYASWIAQNQIAELRLANVQPEVSESNGEVDYAGSSWRWRATAGWQRWTAGNRTTSSRKAALAGWKCRPGWPLHPRTRPQEACIPWWISTPRGPGAAPA